MKLAIMQPYFFPYIGYFQLVAAVEKFVFYDDVNYIKNGWINRNRLYLAGATRYITVPLSGASPYLKINKIEIARGATWRQKMLESIRHSYSKAPYFAPVNDMVGTIVRSDSTKIGDIAKNSVMEVCRYLGLDTAFEASSTVYNNAGLNGQERVLDICGKAHASDYYNLPGGRSLYHADDFQATGTKLHFVAPRLEQYPQFAEVFQPGLSIIDVLMFNDREAVRRMVCAGAAG